VLRFFTISDIHITDVQSPAQAIFFGYQGVLSSAYSGVMLYTHHVLDAAVRTVNDLHREEPIDFGLSLGDTCNSTQFNELRWYIDVLDGGHVDPDSGVRADGDSEPRAAFLDGYRAAGLDPAIPWYQARGNHDHFWTGFLRVDDHLRAAYTGDEILDLGNVFEDPLGPDSRGIYMGCLDGRTPYGDIFGLGPVGDFDEPPASAPTPPRSLTRRVDRAVLHHHVDAGRPRVRSGRHRVGLRLLHVRARRLADPVLVLDDTQDDEEPYDNGYVRLARREALGVVARLDRGQADDVLMIMRRIDRRRGRRLAHGLEQSTAVTEAELIAALRTPTWCSGSGHRHRNIVTAPVPDPARPELGFWQVETASLRDFPSSSAPSRSTRTSTARSRSWRPTSTRSSGRHTGGDIPHYAVAAQQIFDNPIGLLPSCAYNAELVVAVTDTLHARLARRGNRGLTTAAETSRRTRWSRAAIDPVDRPVRPRAGLLPVMASFTWRRRPDLLAHVLHRGLGLVGPAFASRSSSPATCRPAPRPCDVLHLVGGLVLCTHRGLLHREASP
jgi:hypothetical protein